MFIKFFIKKAIKIWQTQKLASVFIILISLILSYFFGFNNFLIFLLFTAWFLFNWNTLPVAVVSIGFIISIPILIFLDLEDVASQISVYTYFSLVILVVLEISRYLKINLWIYRIQRWAGNPNLAFFKKIKDGEVPNLTEIDTGYEKKYQVKDLTPKSNFEVEFVNNVNNNFGNINNSFGNINNSGLPALPPNSLASQKIYKKNYKNINQKNNQSIQENLAENINPDVSINNYKQGEPNFSKTQGSNQVLNRLEQAKKQIQLHLGKKTGKEDYQEYKDKNLTLEIAYLLVLLVFNVIVFNFRNKTALVHWLPTKTIINPNQEILNFSFLTDRFFNFLTTTLNLNAIAVFNTIIQVSFVFLFYINYQISKKIYTLFYKIDLSSKIFLFLLNILIIYNPFSLQKILEGQFQALVSQTLLLGLFQILLSFLIGLNKAEVVYINIFLQKGVLLSLILLLISYFNFELLFLIIPSLILIFGFLIVKWAIKKISQKDMKNDFYIENDNDAGQTKLRNIFQIQFLILIFAFNLGWVFIFMVNMTNNSIRRSLSTEILTKYSPNLESLRNIPLVFSGLKTYNFSQVPALSQIWQNQFISFNFLEYIYSFSILFIFGLLVWITIFHVFLKKRWFFIVPFFFLLLAGIVSLGLNSPVNYFNNVFFSFSSSSYLLLKNQSIWIFLSSLTCLLLISKKIEKVYKYLVFGVLGILVVVSLLPFFSLNQKANTFQVANIVLEVDKECDPNSQRILIHPINKKINSSQTRYPNQPVKNFYTQILNCPVYQPQSFSYRQINNQLKLTPSDTESFFLNRILSEYPNSNRQERLSNLKNTLARKNISFLLLDTAQEDNQKLALSLILDGVEVKREGDLYLFSF